MNFWSWLFLGTGKGPGAKRFLDRWLLVHLAAAVILALLDSIVLKDAANTVLLPLAGIFIGLCFAWGGNAQALLQTDELEDVAEHHPGGFVEYLYVYQTAILLMLVTLAFWGVAGLGVFDTIWPTSQCRIGYRFIRGALFFFASLTVRECWHVVLGAQSMLLIRNQLRRARRDGPPR